jgi:hypothetical protein
MKQIWIGKVFLKDLREVCIIDLSTCREIHTLLTEEQAKEYAKRNNMEVKYTETYILEDKLKKEV